MSDVLTFERHFDLGVGDGEYRSGSRQLVTALLESLKGLRDAGGKTSELSLKVDLSLCVVDAPAPFAHIEESYWMGRDKASNRLGLREMVQAIRAALDPYIAEHGDQQHLVMRAKVALVPNLEQ